MTLHAFLDESFVGDFLMAAALVSSGDVGQGRKAIRGVLDRRQRRIHFRDESDARKSTILDVIENLDVRARVYVTPRSRSAREDCLACLVPDLAAAGVTRLVLERDDSLLKLDRQTLYRLTRAHAPDLEYQHLRAHEDLLLCVADAIAWCWAKGGPWKTRVAAYTTEIRV